LDKKQKTVTTQTKIKNNLFISFTLYIFVNIKVHSNSVNFFLRNLGETVKFIFVGQAFRFASL